MAFAKAACFRTQNNHEVIKKPGPWKPQSNTHDNVSEPVKGTFEATDAGSDVGFKICVRVIALARKKTSGTSRWPESKGRFQKEIKASDWSRSTLRQNTIGVTGTNLLSRKQLSSQTFFSFFILISFFSFKQMTIRYNTMLPNRNNALLSDGNIILL